MNFIKSFSKYLTNESVDIFINSYEYFERKFNLSVEDLEDYLLVFSDSFYVRVMDFADGFVIVIHCAKDDLISSEIESLRRRLLRHGLTFDQEESSYAKVDNGGIVMRELIRLEIKKQTNG